MVRSFCASALAVLLVFSLTQIQFAQRLPQSAAVGSPIVPRLVTFNGILRDGIGRPFNGVLGVTFSLYKDQQGGTPLWTENQNIQADAQGQYTTLLGSSQPSGLPMELFTSGESRWLGVQVQIPGELEQPRVLLVSVPYALKAADAETLGGMPASAFLLREPVEASTPSDARSVQSNRMPLLPRFSGAGTGTSTQNKFVKWTDSNGTLGDGSVLDLGTGTAMYIAPSGNVGIGNVSPAVKLQIQSDSSDALPGNLNNPVLRLSNFNSTANNYAGIEFSSKDNGSFERDGASIQGIFLNRGANTLDTALGLYTRDMSSNTGVHEVRIDQFGNVGIGTTQPTAKLQVESDNPNASPNTLSNTISVLSNYDTTDGNYASLEFRSKDKGGNDRIGATISGVFPTHGQSMVAADLSFYTRSIDGSVNNPLYLKGGNVGVGTSNPTANLEVNGTAKATSFVGNGSGLTNLNVGNLSGSIANNQTSATTANTANSIVARDASGNFSAGTVTATNFVGNFNGVSSTALRTRGIVYLAGCDTCSTLQDTDDQPQFYINVVGSMTIKSIRCFSDGTSTPTININRNTGSASSPVMFSPLQCQPTGSTIATAANNMLDSSQTTLNLADMLDFVMSVAGTAKRVTVAIEAIVN